MLISIFSLASRYTYLCGEVRLIPQTSFLPPFPHSIRTQTYIHSFIIYIYIYSPSAFYTIKIVPDLRLPYTHTRHTSYTHRSRGNLSKSKYRRRNREEKFSRYSRVRVYPPPHLCACVCRLRGPRRANTHTHTPTMYTRSFAIFSYIRTYVRGSVDVPKQRALFPRLRNAAHLARALPECI